QPSHWRSPIQEYAKDERVRLLDLSDLVFDIASDQYGQNILYPTGGFIGSRNNKQYGMSFWEVADIDTVFSGNISGIFVSDKSNNLTQKISQDFVGIDSSSSASILSLAKIYGISSL